MALFDAAAVQRFYDRQTTGFVALGQGGVEGAIHRAVWGPGVRTRAEAFHFVEDRIAEVLSVARERPGFGRVAAAFTEPREPAATRTVLPHVLDLGCGVGGSLQYLARRVPIRGTGITLSPVQAELARTRIRARGLADRVSCELGDFTRLPPSVGDVDLAFAIEAFVHAPAPEPFFAECARVVRAGGHLVVCDDLLVATPTAGAARIVDQFRRGWHVNTLLTAAQLIECAGNAGFAHEETIDLTAWLELARPRDRAIAALLAVFGWLPLASTPIAHLVGGSALQAALQRGWVRYAMVRFRRLPG